MHAFALGQSVDQLEPCTTFFGRGNAVQQDDDQDISPRVIAEWLLFAASIEAVEVVDRDRDGLEYCGLAEESVAHNIEQQRGFPKSSSGSR